MKLLKAKNRKPNLIEFDISELPRLDGRGANEDIVATGVMLDPIEVEDRRGDRFLGTRYGAGGRLYVHQDYRVHKGNSRVWAAQELGYTHIEGIWFASRNI